MSKKLRYDKMIAPCGIYGGICNGHIRKKDILRMQNN